MLEGSESLGYRIFENLKSNLSSDLDTKVENSWLKAFQETKKQRLTLEGIKQSINDNLIEELENVKNGKYNAKEITVGKTSENLANILNMPKEYANLDVVLDVGKAKKIMDYNPDNFHLHNLDPNTIYNALVASEDPAAIFIYKDANGNVSKNRLTLVTDVMDYKDDYIMVSFEISSGPNEKYDVNKDITIFGRKNILNQMQNAISDNRMLHLNKEKVSLIAGSKH